MPEVVKIELSDREKTIIAWAKDYANDVDRIEKHMIGNEPYRFCITDFYKWFIKEKGLTRLEDLPENEKKEIFDKSIEICSENVGDIVRKQICEFVYVMNHVFDKYFV